MVVFQWRVDARQRKLQVLHRAVLESLSFAFLRGSGVRTFVAVGMLPVMLVILPVPIGVPSCSGGRVRAGCVSGASARRAARSGHIRQQKAIGFLHVIGGILVQWHSHVAVGGVGDAGDEIAGRIDRVSGIGRVCVRVEVLIDY